MGTIQNIHGPPMGLIIIKRFAKIGEKRVVTGLINNGVDSPVAFLGRSRLVVPRAAQCQQESRGRVARNMIDSGYCRASTLSHLALSVWLSHLANLCGS